MSDGLQLRFRRRAGVLSRRLEDESVLLDVESAKYFALNETGSRVLELCDDGRTVEEILAAVEAEYEGAGAAKSDVFDLLERLEGAQLIERVEPVPGGRGLEENRF